MECQGMSVSIKECQIFTQTVPVTENWRVSNFYFPESSFNKIY